MFSIGAKNEAEEIALVNAFLLAKTLVGKIGKPIRLKIQHSDGLHGHGFLRAIAVVEQRGITPIGAEGDGGGKAVGAGNSPG